MSRIAVEHVDAAADDLGRVEAWPHRPEMFGVLGQHFFRGIIGVGHDEIAIHHHDRGGDPVDHRLRLGQELHVN